jgi:hypothetical protein
MSERKLDEKYNIYTTLLESLDHDINDAQSVEAGRRRGNALPGILDGPEAICLR